jgi:hypothetical protein
MHPVGSLNPWPHPLPYPQDKVQLQKGKWIANLGGWEQNNEEAIETGRVPKINNIIITWN